MTALRTLLEHPVGKQFAEAKINYFLHGDKSVQLAAIETDEELRPLLLANAQLFRSFQLSNQNRTIQIVRHPDHLFDDVNFNLGFNSNPISPQDTALLLAHIQAGGNR